MARSGYSDSCDGWDLIRWRGAVASAIRGKHGQAFLKELLAAFDALPEKRLIKNSFQNHDGYCTLGVVAASRHVELPPITEDDDPFEIRALVKRELKIPDALAAEIMYENDEHESGYFDPPETPEQRYARMRRWIVMHIKEPCNAVATDSNQ